MLGDYTNQLENDVRVRYCEKIKMCDGIDPYMIKKTDLSTKVQEMPNITYIDIVNYFVYKKSAYTQRDFKAYKSLEAYKMFQCNWITSVGIKRCRENVLVISKVMHSQSINEKCLEPWIIATKEGEILTAHCTCVAGLGECCSHVAAVTFLIDDAVRNFETPTVTEKKAYWVMPKKCNTMLKSENINFNSARKASFRSSSSNGAKQNATYSPLTETELGELLNKLYDNKVNSSVLFVTKPFCQQLAEDENVDSTASFLSLFDVNYENLSLEELIAITSRLEITISETDCLNIEEITKGQSQNDLWYMYREGRITASNFKGVCQTKIENPSLSLIKKICYPRETKFVSKATQYGCVHEKTAVDRYKSEMEKKHTNFILKTVGLIINPEYPWYGASLDAAVECECCGAGCAEIKCPYCARDTSIKEMCNLPKAYIKEHNSVLRLDPKHQYYFQIQMQLHVAKKKYCDFVVWSEKDIYLERIYPNGEFWKEQSLKAKQFWLKVIGPELLGRYFTKKLKIHNASSTASTVM